MPRQLEVQGLSDIGLVRSNNEDVWSEIPEACFYVIADGMGGHRAGEVAARLAVMSLCKTVERACFPLSIERAFKTLEEGVATANRVVYTMSQSDAKTRGMGTTLSCLLLLENTLVYAHVGDSRIYRLRQGRIEQLTQDHSLRNEVIAKGELHEESSLALPKNVITRAIGTASSVEPELGALPFFSGDLYLLCSDGLSDHVHADEILRVLEQQLSLKERAAALISLAKERGSSDNITVVVIKVG